MKITIVTDKDERRLASELGSILTKQGYEILSNVPLTDDSGDPVGKVYNRGILGIGASLIILFISSSLIRSNRETVDKLSHILRADSSLVLVVSMDSTWRNFTSDEISILKDFCYFREPEGGISHEPEVVRDYVLGHLGRLDSYPTEKQTAASLRQLVETGRSSVHLVDEIRGIDSVGVAVIERRNLDTAASDFFVLVDDSGTLSATAKYLRRNHVSLFENERTIFILSLIHI